MKRSVSKLLRSRAVLAAIGGIVATLILVLVVVLLLALTGVPKAVSDNAALIAALVALGGVFTAQMVSIALEAKRTHEARDLEEKRSQEDAKQAYFERMGTLLTDKKLAGTEREGTEREGTEREYIKPLAQAQTHTVLARLDGERKRPVVRFLYETGLIKKGKLIVVELRDADLSGANLSDADLSGAKLGEANLSDADLSGAKLGEADLSGADLSGADLSNANGVANEQLSAASSLEGATMPDGQTLRSDKMPNGPTLEDWIENKKAREEGG